MFGIPQENADSADTQADEAGRRRLWVDGQCWFVREIAAPAFDRRGGTHLLFESLEIIRRVRVFPANWNELADEPLYALSMDLRPRPDIDANESQSL